MSFSCCPGINVSGSNWVWVWFLSNLTGAGRVHLPQEWSVGQGVFTEQGSFFFSYSKGKSLVLLLHCGPNISFHVTIEVTGSRYGEVHWVPLDLDFEKNNPLIASNRKEFQFLLSCFLSVIWRNERSQRASLTHSIRVNSQIMMSDNNSCYAAGRNKMLHKIYKIWKLCDRYKVGDFKCSFFFPFLTLVGSHYWSCRHPIRKWLLWIWCVFPTRLSKFPSTGESGNNGRPQRQI